MISASSFSEQKLIKVMLCCNDTCGSASGYLSALTIDDLIHIEGYGVPCIVVPSRLKIAEHLYTINGYQSHVGNNCWDEIEITLEDAASLLNLLSLLGWDLVEATANLWDKFGAITAANLSEVQLPS